MNKSKKLKEEIRAKTKYAIGTIALLILGAIIAIYGGNIFANNAEEKVKSSSPRIENTDKEIYIYDEYDMQIFRDSVNAGNDYGGKTVYLMQDIDLKGICSEEIGSWEPIGTSEKYFAGTFDGKYHTIKNLYINTK